jgi:hypothetical protein
MEHGFALNRVGKELHRHSREGGNPEKSVTLTRWIPAFAGMTKPFCTRFKHEFMSSSFDFLICPNGMSLHTATKNQSSIVPKPRTTNEVHEAFACLTLTARGKWRRKV